MTDATAAKPAYRHDLDGLRAFAIALVVIYHVWIGRVSGGVDVFLLLSAYFLTASLVRRSARGRMGLGQYFAHRFWRLVPAAAATIAGTMLAVWAVFPKSLWPAAWDQSIASLLYVQNWELALTAVDYYARDSSSLTPFLHFWSLSIQGQVFVLWPLLIALGWGISKLARISFVRVIAVLFAGVLIASFAYSVITTAQRQGFAYFDTGARLWEFAAGSLLALLPAHLRLPRWLAEVLSVVGVLALVTCGIVLDVSGGFPGYLALWPVLAAAALIVGGRESTFVGRMLASRPLRWLGKIAYSLYLVHWPVLIVWLLTTGAERVSLREGAIVIAISVVAATVLHVLIERPLQRWKAIEVRPWRTYLAIGVAATLVAGPIIGWRVETDRAAAEAAANTDFPGAAAEDDGGAYVAGTAFTPAGTALDRQWVSLGEDCTGGFAPQDELLAATCVMNAGHDADQLVVFVGDSHAQQWMGAFLPNVNKASLKVVGLFLGGCTYAPDSPEPIGYGDRDTCIAWNAAARAYIQEARPAVVVMMGTRAAQDSPDETAIEGISQTVAALTANGTKVVIVRDNPRFGEDKYRCAEDAAAEDIAVCSVPAREAYARQNPVAWLAGMPDAYLVDMSDMICPAGTCPVIIGNVAVYLDDNHLTWAFAKTLAPYTDRRLQSAGFRWNDL